VAEDKTENGANAAAAGIRENAGAMRGNGAKSDLRQ
jgi:hypothetical protein